MHRSVQSLLTPVLLILLAGCSALEFAQKVPPEDDTDTRPTEKTTECEWHEIRGVAELIAISNGEGTFVFYPGEHRVQARVEEGWAEGHEFTSILRRPEPEYCANPRLRIVKPLTPAP